MVSSGKMFILITIFSYGVLGIAEELQRYLMYSGRTTPDYGDDLDMVVPQEVWDDSYVLRISFTMPDSLSQIGSWDGLLGHDDGNHAYPYFNTNGLYFEKQNGPHPRQGVLSISNFDAGASYSVYFQHTNAGGDCFVASIEGTDVETSWCYDYIYSASPLYAGCGYGKGSEAFSGTVTEVELCVGTDQIEDCFGSTEGEWVQVAYLDGDVAAEVESMGSDTFSDYGKLSDDEINSMDWDIIKFEPTDSSFPTTYFKLTEPWDSTASRPTTEYALSEIDALNSIWETDSCNQYEICNFGRGHCSGTVKSAMGVKWYGGCERGPVVGVNSVTFGDVRIYVYVQEPCMQIRNGQDLPPGTGIHTFPQYQRVDSDIECKELCESNPECTAWITDSPENPSRITCFATKGPVSWEPDSTRNGGIPCRDGSTNLPTLPPTILETTSSPSNEPTTEIPSKYPSHQPSEIPSKDPSHLPSHKPSEIPTKYPSHQPSEIPSKDPSKAPTADPSHKPSAMPSNSCQNYVCEDDHDLLKEDHDLLKDRVCEAFEAARSTFCDSSNSMDADTGRRNLQKEENQDKVDISRIFQDLNKAVRMNLITEKERVTLKKSLFQSCTTNSQINIMVTAWGNPTTSEEILLSLQEARELLN